MVIYILGLVCLVICFRIFRFLTTPVLKKIGFYKYYSPMFMTMPWFFNSYDLHLGTSWDFIKVDVNLRKMMCFIAEGLINISKEIEKGLIKKTAKFKGNTFYLKESTVKRFGFNSKRMNLFETILFVFNYFELCLLNSIAKKEISFIPVKNVRIVYSTAEEILVNKKKIEKALDALNRGAKNNNKLNIRSESKPAKKSEKQISQNRNEKLINSVS